MLRCVINANSAANEVIGVHSNYLKVKIAAAAVDGSANKALQKFLADQFEVSVSQVKIMRGLKSKKKLISIQQPIIVPLSIAKLIKVEHTQS